ncbi:MAG TPA: biotin-dependent carboxyltransferase family protein [Chthoniobacterales bacterium]|nr:biotin-dependent carboxyltransferase family protein [Chthoniobacterales bacterium]
MNFTAVRAGFLTTVQDLGRVGFRDVGVPMGGALDQYALRVANLVVANDESAAGLEITFGNVRLQFHDERLVAWCGGGFPVTAVTHVLSAGRPALLRAGEEIFFRAAEFGCRAWLAISGGIDVPPVLGSRSTDMRGAFGGFAGRTLRDGDEIPVGASSAMTAQIGHRIGDAAPASWSASAEWASVGRAPGLLRFVRGIDWDRFEEEAHATLIRQAFRVSPDSDRMGVRFESSPLKLKHPSDLLSEAVAPGTIQVPPSGEPIALLGDCQTIGGYPKIAHVISVDLSVAAQLRAHERVHFREISVAEAHRLLVRREEELARFRVGLEAVLR